MNRQTKDLTDDVMLAVIRASRQLRAASHPSEPLTWPADLLPEFPEREVEAKMAQLYERGIIDYGVSPRSAWVVGEELEA